MQWFRSEFAGQPDAPLAQGGGLFEPEQLGGMAPLEQPPAPLTSPPPASSVQPPQSLAEQGDMEADPFSEQFFRDWAS